MSKSITAGIDFGNQTCVLSIPTKFGVDIILNQSSNRKTPTIIGYQNERRFSGEFALQQHMLNINNTITELKQLVGLHYHSQEREEMSKSVPYKIVCLNDNGLSGIQLEDNTILRPEQIIAYLLKSLLEIIQMKNPRMQQLVISVPIWWNELQKRTILNAASISKIKVASLIDSMTAAAISYVKIHSDRFSSEPEKKSNVVFIDIGDISMNIAVASLSKRSIEIKGFATDKTISGQFFTKQLEEFLLKKVQEKYKIDPKINKRAMIRFRQAAEKVKKALSANSIIMFEVPSLMNDIDVSIPVKRDEFNELIQNHIEKVETTIEEALKNSNILKEDVSSIEILGGGSRMPIIKAKIKEFFGCEPMMSLDLDECFAIGAGYMAAKADGYDIGIDTISSIYPYDVDAEYETQLGGSTENKIQRINVIKKGTKIPTNSTFSLPVFHKNNVSLISDNNKVGNIEICSEAEEMVDVDVTISFDSFGLINIANTALKNKDNKADQKEIKEKDEEEKDENMNNEEKKNDKVEEEKKSDKVEEEKKSDKIEENQAKNDFKGSFIYYPFNVTSQSNIAEYEKIEEDMEIKDKREIEIDSTKNDLESLILSTLNELNSITINNETDKGEIDEIKEKVNEVFTWFSENEFERLTLDEYKSKIAELKVPIDQLNEHKKYHEVLYRLDELKQILTSDIEIVQNDKERIALKESIELQSEIPELISKINEIIDSPKKNVCEFDIISFEKHANEIDSKTKTLKNLPLIEETNDNSTNKIKEESPKEENEQKDTSEITSYAKDEKKETNVETKQDLLIENEKKEAEETISTDSSKPKDETKEIVSQSSSRSNEKEQLMKETVTQLSSKPTEKEEENKKESISEPLSKQTEEEKESLQAIHQPEAPVHDSSRIKIKRHRKFNNNEHKIKLEPLKPNRPLSNNQKYRIKLPPLPPLEDEETDLLSESQLKNYDTINTIFDKEMQNKPSLLLRSSTQQKEDDAVAKEKDSNLPPLIKVSKENNQNDNSRETKNTVRIPKVPIQQRRVGPSFRFYAP
ncbi:hypothetical protein M9Y10_039921 [Tritrichomonas musculus]|uniref:DnaK protein n=1 Tax=Tritrichomonas musculus TaxID=1915356 RepID=A0ABR2GSR9_9EUKA